MVLDDSLQYCWRARMVPDTFGIDDRDGAARANPEAIHLAAIDQRLGTHQPQFLQSFFQKLPGLEARFFGAAIRLGLIRAQQDVPPIPLQPERRHRLLQGPADFVYNMGQCYPNFARWPFSYDT